MVVVLVVVSITVVVEGLVDSVEYVFFEEDLVMVIDGGVEIDVDFAVVVVIVGVVVS